MKDHNYSVQGLTQRASGYIDYGAPANGDTVIVDGNTFTKVAAAPGAGQFSNITELEALVEAVSGITSSVSGQRILVAATAPGTAGNSKTLALGGGNTGTMSISGATLTGGVAATYTPTFPLDNFIGLTPGKMLTLAKVANFAGTNVIITPQTSYDPDKYSWIDLTSAAETITGNGETEFAGSETGFRGIAMYLRFKIVMSGNDTYADIDLTAFASFG